MRTFPVFTSPEHRTKRLLIRSCAVNRDALDKPEGTGIVVKLQGAGMEGYVKCDRCSARALREFVLDNGLTLYGCLHHAAQWAPGQPQDVRFNLEPMSLGGYLGTDTLAHLDQELSLNA